MAAMKAFRQLLSLAALPALTSMLSAQAVTPIPVTPTTPQSFKIKPVGESASAGATVAPSAVPAVKQTTYVTLGSPRQWKSADGNSRIGTLIAWEQSVLTIPVTDKNNPAAGKATPPSIAGKPTIVRDGKIRLLIERKAYEVPLDRLGSDEQDYIQKFQTSLAAKP